MSTAFSQAIENIEDLTADERALLAHCLISSLEIRHDDSVDQAWGELAKKRLSELESGSVEGVSWEEIKSSIKQ